MTFKRVASCVFVLAIFLAHDGERTQAQEQAGTETDAGRAELRRWRHRDDLLTALYFPLSHDPVRRATIAALLVADEQWRDGSSGSLAWPGVRAWFDEALNRSRRAGRIVEGDGSGRLKRSADGFVVRDGKLLSSDRPMVEAGWYCSSAATKLGNLRSCELNACLGFRLAVVEEVAVQERCCLSTLRTCGIDTVLMESVPFGSLAKPDARVEADGGAGCMYRLTGLDEQILPPWLRCRMSAQLLWPRATCARLETDSEKSVSRAGLWAMVLNGARIVYNADDGGRLNPMTLENLAHAGFEWLEHAEAISRFPSRADIGVVTSAGALADGSSAVANCVKTLADHQIRFELLPVVRLDRNDMTDVLRFILLVDTNDVSDKSIARLKRLRREGVFIASLSEKKPEYMDVDFHFAPHDTKRLIEVLRKLQARRLLLRDAVVPRSVDGQPMPGVLSDSMELDDGTTYVNLINLSERTYHCELVSADKRVEASFTDVLTGNIVGTGTGAIELKPQAVLILKAVSESP